MFEVNLRRAEGSVALTVESGCVRGNFILCLIFVKTSPKQFDGSSIGRFPQAEPGRELTQPSPYLLAEPCMAYHKTYRYVIKHIDIQTPGNSVSRMQISEESERS